MEPSIRAGLSKGDIVGPYGDHELLLVLGSAEDAARLQRIHEAISNQLADAACTIMIGVAAASSEDTQPMGSLFLRADDALWGARGAGASR
ncbi:MAG: diguanylate cyclase domain-containing protein [Luteimonas sp.]